MRQKCPFCEIEKRSMSTLISHINKHYETPKKERKKQIDRIKQESSPAYQKENEIRKVKKVLVNQELITFKEKVIPILAEFEISKNILNGISRSRDLTKLKRLIEV